MIKPIFVFCLTILSFIHCNSQVDKIGKVNFSDSIIKLEMKLDVSQVESIFRPEINVFIDFTKDSSYCKKTFNNPAFKSSSYKLTTSEIKEIYLLLDTVDLERLKNRYTVSSTDQQISITKIFTTQKTYIVWDYGLKGDNPLQQLYSIVYKKTIIYKK